MFQYIKLNYKKISVGALLFMVIAFVPLIVRLQLITVTNAELVIFINHDTDLFSYVKSVIFIALMSVLTILLIAYKLTSNEEHRYFNALKNTAAISALVYVLFVFLSSVFSPHGALPFTGGFQRYENMYVLLFYIVLMAVVYTYAKSKNRTDAILYAFLFSGLGLTLIGLTQFLGNDIFNWDSMFIKRLVLGELYDTVMTSAGTVYGASYNPNPFAMYLAMIIPFSAMIALFYPLKSVAKYLFLLLTILALISFIGASSSGGLIGLAAAVTLLSVTFLIIFIKFKSYILIGASFGAVCLLLLLFLFVPPFSEFTDRTIAKLRSEITVSYFLEDIDVQRNSVNLITKAGEFSVISTKMDTYRQMEVIYQGEILDPFDITFHGEPNQEDPDNPHIIAISDHYLLNGYHFEIRDDYTAWQMYNVPIFFLMSGGNRLMIAENQNGFFMVSRMGHIYDLSQEIPNAKLFNETFASSRGFIWNRTLPLLPGKLFLGSGPDTFALEFPYHDILGTSKYMGLTWQVTDKPHNFFLQVFVNTGGISLIALLVLFGTFYVYTYSAIFGKRSKLKLISLITTENEETKTEQTTVYTFIKRNALRFACLGGVTGYLVASLSTDSVISVAPLFWALLGLGFACNTVITVRKKAKSNKR
jgi:hypothetical protein